MSYPARGFPLFDTLSAFYFVFIGFGVVDGGGEEGGCRQTGMPGRGEIGPIVDDSGTEVCGEEGAEVGTSEDAFAEHFLGGFVGFEGGVGGEVEGAALVAGGKGLGSAVGGPLLVEGGDVCRRCG